MEKEKLVQEKLRGEILYKVLKEFHEKDVSLQRSRDIVKFYKIVIEMYSEIIKCLECGKEQYYYETRK